MKTIIAWLLLCVVVPVCTKAMEDCTVNQTEDLWNKLPHELQVEIILYLQEISVKVFLGCELVNRQWRSLVQDCPLAAIKKYRFADKKTITLYDLFFKAVEEGHCPVVSILIGYGVDINQKKQFSQQTTQIIAEEQGCTKLIELLINCRIDGEAQIDGHTPLMIAARKGHIEIVKLLIAHNADVNAHDNLVGYTALMQAVRHGHINVAKQLLKAGAHIDAHTIFGNTALIEAAACNNIPMVTLLLECGANIRAHNSYEQSALTIALESSDTDLIKVLDLFLKRGQC